MSTLFNRKDTTVIEFALNNTLEDFLQQYSNTSANEDTLTKAYNEIVSNKTKANIAVQSGGGDPTKPLTPIGKKEEYSLDKSGEIKVPQSLTLNKGKVVKTTPNPDPATSTEETTTSKSTKKQKTEKSKATPKEKVQKEKTTTSGEKPGPSKRDAIKAFLQIEGNAAKTNKEIKEYILSQGYNSCYDSEISAVKSKL